MCCRTLPLDALGRDVSRLVLGTMLLTDSGPRRSTSTCGSAATRSTRRACTATATAERALGAWLEQRPGVRERLVIVSKGAHPSGDAQARDAGRTSQRDLRVSVDLLGGPIDLYLLHRDDPSVPVGTIVECLTALREAGLLRAYGTSNWTTARIDEANAWAAAHGLDGFCISSQHLSLAVQNEEQWPDTRSANDPDRLRVARADADAAARLVGPGARLLLRPLGREVLRVYDNEVNRERRRRARGCRRAARPHDRAGRAGVGAAPAVPGLRRVRRPDAAQVREAFGALDVDPEELAGLTE